MNLSNHCSPAPKLPPRPAKEKRRPRKKSAKHDAEWLRAFGSVERMLWIKAQPCIVGLLCDWSRPRENAHIENGGISRKADAEKIVPLCVTHHRAFHRIGRDSFEKHWGIDLEQEAAETAAVWRVVSGESE